MAEDVTGIAGPAGGRVSGVAILRLAAGGKSWQFDSFLISCRVLGRGFEREFAARCIERARSKHDAPIRAQYSPGPKNSQTSKFFDDLGFHLVEEAADGTKTYELPVGASTACNSSHVTFTWE